MVLAATGSGYPLLSLFWTMLILFGFVLWFWLLIVIFSDIFRRDLSGWGKAAWSIFVIVLPYLGVFVYLISQGRGMAERRRDEAVATRARYEQDIRSIAANGRVSEQPADQIATAKRLLDAGEITQDEYEILKRRALGLPAHASTP
jgi:Short C-terminal domain/Phospholipase_D-nuclease N-terminal